MSKSDADTTAMLVEIRKQTLLWEQATCGSREDFDAAEAATRVMAELDAALCMGAHLPVPWQVAQYPQEPLTAKDVGGLIAPIPDLTDKEIDDFTDAIREGREDHHGTVTTEEVARQAYQAYAGALGIDRSHAGKTWEQLPSDRRRAWLAVAGVLQHDLTGLRDLIEAALDGSIDRCARCKTCDVQVDAVMYAITVSLFGGESPTRGETGE